MVVMAVMAVMAVVAVVAVVVVVVVVFYNETLELYYDCISTMIVFLLCYCFLLKFIAFGR